MASDKELFTFLRYLNSQEDAYKKREQSREERNYGWTMEKSARALRIFTQIATFDQLLVVEKGFQEKDLESYAKSDPTRAAVKEAMFAFNEGAKSYKQLRENTQAYINQGYDKKDRTGSQREIPLDAMRKALRGQASRVQNYRKNVMSNPKEQEFINARAAMLKHAEKLYDRIQRDILGRSGA